LGLNLFFTPSPATVAPDALEAADGAVPGATAERVAKLEKDVSSLLLKMVSLEKDMETLQNRNLTPAKVTELTNKMVALQSQLNNLNARVGSRSSSSGSSSAAGQPDKPATSSTSSTTAAASQSAQPVASSQVEDRAGDKPDPLATRMGGTTNPAAAPSGANQPVGQPRATYTVMAGDTLFGIAQRYKVTTNQLMTWNNMKDTDVLKPGKVLNIY
jgi:LysM repeat protein